MSTKTSRTAALEGSLVSLAGWSARYPARALTLMATLAALAALAASQLAFAGDYAELLPDDASETRDYRWAVAQNADAWFTLLAVEGNIDPTSTAQPPLEEWIDGLADAVTTLPDVDYVMASFPDEFFRERALYYASDEEIDVLDGRLSEWSEDARRRANPLYIDLEDEQSSEDLRRELEEELNVESSQLADAQSGFESPDGRYRFIWVRPTFSPMDIARSSRLMAALEATIERHHAVGAGPAVRIAGPYAALVAEDAEITQDLESTSGWAALLVFLIVVFQTRSLRSLLVIGMPLLVAIALTLAWAWLWLGELNVVSGFLTPVLFGLGVDFGIHFHDAFARGRREGASRVEAAQGAAEASAGGCLGATLTTSAAFCALGMSDFRGFSDFGAIGAFGVLAALLTTFAFAPALLCLVDARASAKAAHAPEEAIPRRVAIFVVVVACLTTLLATIALPSLAFEGDLDALRAESDALAFDAYVESAVGGAAAPALVYLQDPEHEEAVRGSILTSSAELGLTNIVSIQDFIPTAPALRSRRLSALHQGLSEVSASELDESLRPLLAQALSLTSPPEFRVDDLPPLLRQRFAAGDETLLILQARYDESSIETARAWSVEMERVRRAHPEVHILSGAAVAGRLFDVVFHDVPWAVGATLGAVLLLLLLLLGRGFFWPFVLTLLPLVTLAGLMAALGIKLNIFNALMLPTLLGVGVDNAFHMHKSAERAVGGWYLLATTGRSAFSASATTAAAFGVLMMAQHRGIASIGTIAVLGIALASFYTIAVYACVLRLREPKSPTINESWRN